MSPKFLIPMVFGVFLSCSDKRTTILESSTNSVELYLEIPDKAVNKSSLFYDNQKSLWSLNNQIYSGYAESFFEDDKLKERFGILNGKKQGLYTLWYEDGHYHRIANYHKGKLYGDKKSWSHDSSHILLSHFKYISGQLHGEQKKWYPTGELFKNLNLKMGKEDGIQKAFRKNGALFANYEALNGRIFGLKKAVLCYGLEDEKIQSQKD